MIPVTQPTPSQSGADATTVPQPSDQRSPLPRYPEEAAVVDAIATAGFRVDSIGLSKFEDYIFGERKRARYFGAPVEGTRERVRVDVLFLDAPVGDVRVCPAPDPHNYWIVTDGRRATVGGSGEIFFAVSERYFVLSSDVRVREAMRVAFGLKVPTC